MIIEGRYNNAVVYTDVIEDTAIEQLRGLCDLEWSKGLSIKIMPDVHAGSGCTIGTTMTLRDRVCPSMVGVDISCGVLVAKIEKTDIDFSKLDAVIRRYIPYGMNVHQKRTDFDLTGLKASFDKDRALRSIGTLGGGNHFIEIDTDGDYDYVVIHSGSRHLGVEVCKYYQDKAYDEYVKGKKVKIDNIIKELKAQGRENEISSTLKSMNIENIRKETLCIDGEDFRDYINDMKIVNEYATQNREAMLAVIVHNMSFNVIDTFCTRHNYIDVDNMILRKGAVSAQNGERLIIPLNMRDGSLICRGRGNKEWNYSAPHGAGRLLSRGDARRNVMMDEFIHSMEGIYSTTVNDNTIDESPMAYKRKEDIIDNIKDTVEIEKVITPLYNFKADK